ncbi:MAG: succinate--CoA ligase subunit alpha [Candidatus Terraquivivens tikiterensis]|uniref:Succinate--CoA ligase [ADP-forming] subunit alpha n=1 Tax=Candidatus Terraquivivens tikiterensis TaxID=1980982 RepID=A0A2R7YA24_9ARCH|nr:MAG: succinate--CoA ligase subunit alpha [Candidatus Terraquivivens tikiterensis]
MAVLVDKNTYVLVQGITGREGSFHTKAMLEYGTKVLAGVTPGKGGQSVHGVPVYDSVYEAVSRHPELNTSIIFVPSAYASDAVYEAIDAGMEVVVLITEHIPVHDSMKFIRYARLRGVRIVGPNCPGVISPGESKVGIMPGHVFSKGKVGIVSRSGTLTYEVAHAITKAGLGQSTAVGIGGDPITGMSMIDMLEMFREDEETEAVVLIGEIGGDMEERAAEYIKRCNYEKPVVAFVAGRTAPPGKRMGHAGAIISMGAGDAEGKIRAFEASGVRVASTPAEVVKLLKDALRSG